MDSPDSSTPSSSRGRGRGKSRGGLGKYLRARGRGRGRGRPAEFGKRLVLEDEQEAELEEEEAKELEKKYARRQLGTNADRYAELEPELDSDGEPIVEPEVDLTSFLEKQRQLPPQLQSSAPPPPEDDDEIDQSVAALNLDGKNRAENDKKGKTKQIEWDDTLEELSREKAAADATRELKSRFKVQSTRPSFRAPVKHGREKVEKSYIEAPALPSDIPAPPKSEKEGLEDFLDDLLG